MNLIPVVIESSTDRSIAGADPAKRSRSSSPSLTTEILLFGYLAI
ncbi:hypothetical protein [Thalassoporum mexicanum]|nr:hypothetical protein [Pseudanabaena sp. PCC 7367]